MLVFSAIVLTYKLDSSTPHTETTYLTLDLKDSSKTENMVQMKQEWQNVDSGWVICMDSYHHDTIIILLSLFCLRLFSLVF